MTNRIIRAEERQHEGAEIAREQIDCVGRFRALDGGQLGQFGRDSFCKCVGDALATSPPWYKRAEEYNIRRRGVVAANIGYCEARAKAGIDAEGASERGSDG